jgi:hypothetical protein
MGCSRKISPETPDTSAVFAKPADTLPPPSQIDVPVYVNLKSLYAFAEKYVDVSYNSAGWPNDWEYDGCKTRYMYAFRRGPLQLNGTGNLLDLSFTGYYKVKGSQRGCIGGLGVTPWSPTCACGINEPERRVQIGFSGSFNFNPNYTISTKVITKEPQALDACEVCFFKTDITPIILSNIKPQLDTARLLVQQQLAAYSLRPWFEQVWQQLQQTVPLQGYGYLHLNPTAVRLNQYSFMPGTSVVKISAGLTARPLVNFDSSKKFSPLPLLDAPTKAERFAIYTDARLPYDSINRIINQQFAGTRIVGEKGLVKNKYIIVNRIALLPRGGDQLMVEADVSGSVSGTIYLTGKPVYQKESARLEFQDLDYDIKTRNALLKTAGWLMNKKITRRLTEAAHIEMRGYLAELQRLLTKELNRTLTKGITTSGRVNRILVSELLPQPTHLFVRLYAEGALSVKVEELSF